MIKGIWTFVFLIYNPVEQEIMAGQFHMNGNILQRYFTLGMHRNKFSAKAKQNKTLGQIPNTFFRVFFPHVFCQYIFSPLHKLNTQI